MLVDGYKGFKFGEGFWIEGEYFWNLDYYVQFNESKVYWSYLIFIDVDVKVRVWKVYFGIFVFLVENDQYVDIWWKKVLVGDGWIGVFFVWGFSWRLGCGWRDVEKVYIVYNLLSVQDMSVENIIVFQNIMIQFLIKVENVIFCYLIGGFYLVKRG